MQGHDMTTIVHPINLLVSDEYDRAAKLHGAVFASPHEGYGVLAEEVQEAGDEADLIDADFVTPQTVIDHAWQDNYKDEIMRNLSLYTLMVNDGVPCEDARYVLPQAFTCNVVMTMNARELRHFFSLRCCSRAQWEIRHLARQMLALCQDVAPTLFADAGPGCVRGHCPEGEKSCKNDK